MRIYRILLVMYSIVSGILLIRFPMPTERVVDLQNNLITVGGIISAFMMAYLSSKIFNLRSERLVRQKKIDHYSDKLTLFRRLLHYVMFSRNFWNYFDDIEKFKKKYAGLNYETLHNDSESELALKFWLEEKDINQSTIDLYCAMESISGPTSSQPGFATLTWHSEKAARFDYSESELNKFYSPSNQIWYYLEGRYAKHGIGRFNDSGIWILYESEVSDIMTRIDSKFKGKSFHRTILAEISSEFYEYYIPKLLSLTRGNLGVPKELIKTFNNLLLLMVTSVLFPLLLQSIKVTNCFNVLASLIFVWLTTIILFRFLIDFYGIINHEVELKDIIKSNSKPKY